MGGVVGMIADVEDEEGGDIFSGLDVGDGGEAAMVFWGEAELLAVPEFWRGLLVGAASGFCGFDDCGDVVGVTVDGEASDELGGGDAFGVEVGGVGAEEGGELGAGGVAADEDTVGVSAELPDIFVDPAGGFCDVAGEGFHVDVGEEAIVCCDEDEAFGGEPIGFGEDVGFVSGLPSAAVDPEDDGFIGVGFCGVVDIEDVAWVPGFGVGDVALDGLREGGLAEEEGEEEEGEGAHGVCGGGGGYWLEVGSAGAGVGVGAGVGAGSVGVGVAVSWAALSARTFLMDWSHRFQLEPWSSPTRTARKPLAVSAMGWLGVLAARRRVGSLTLSGRFRESAVRTSRKPWERRVFWR